MNERDSDRRQGSLLGHVLAALGLLGLMALVRYVAHKLPSTNPLKKGANAGLPNSASAHAGNNTAGQASSGTQGEDPSPPATRERVAVRHERSDLRFSWILGLLVVIVGVGAVQFYVVRQLFDYQAAAQAEDKRSPYPPVPTQLPPAPQLEQLERMAGDPNADVQRQLLAAEHVLDSYGPTPDRGFVHVPIAEAMTQVAGRLPVRKVPGDGGVKGRGLLDAGASNSGRIYQGAVP